MEQKNRSVLPWLIGRALLIAANTALYYMFLDTAFASTGMGSFFGSCLIMLLLFIVLCFVKPFNIVCLLISFAGIGALYAYIFSGWEERIDHHNIEYFYSAIAEYLTMGFVGAELIVFAIIRGVMYYRKERSQPQEQQPGLSESIDIAFTEPPVSDDDPFPK